MHDLVAIVALALLCAAWMGFQLWLKRVDPDGRHIERDGCGGCASGCRRRREGAGPH